MSNVVKFHGNTTLDIQADEMLKEIASEQPQEAIVISLLNHETHLHCSFNDLKKIVFYLEKVKHMIMSGTYRDV
jgi:hypothetical protein